MGDDEKRHMFFRDAKTTLCNHSTNEWITALLDWPIEDICPDCLERLVELIRIHKRMKDARR